MKCAVVILNYNGLELLKRFLPDVVRHSDRAQIYLADNGSSDHSVLWVQNNHAQVNIIALDHNYGYAEGHNRALESVTEPLVILLNNDVQVSAQWTLPIITAFEQNSSLAAAQPKILNLNQPSHFEYAGAAGGFLDQLGYPFCQGRIFNTLEQDTKQYDQSTELFWASGACLCLRHENFKKIEGFDIDLFAHQEEIDLCWRLKSQGGLVMLIPEVSVLHLGGGTLSKHAPQKTYLNFRNSLLVLTKMVAGPKVILIIFLRLILDGLAGIKFLLNGQVGHTWAILRAHLSYYAKLPQFLAKRRTAKSDMPYAKTNSIVVQYYLLKKRSFRGL